MQYILEKKHNNHKGYKGVNQKTERRLELIRKRHAIANFHIVLLIKKIRNDGYAITEYKLYR